MKIDLLNNSGVVNFKDELENQMSKTKNFDIATAFITEEAIKVLNIFLNENKNRNRIGRLITSFYHCFNSQEVLIKLQELVKNSKGRLLVNMSINERFHWKCYNFKNDNEQVSYIGSSNFTGVGMKEPGELMLKLFLSNRDKSEKENLQDLYNKEFENSIDILKFPLEEYEQSKSVTSRRKSLPLSIRNILISKEKLKPIKKEETQIQVIFLNGYVSAKTVKIIKEKKTNWDENYFPCYRKSDYDITIKVGLIFFIENYYRKYSFSIAEVIDNCQIRTPDGNYFIAYKVRKRINRESERLKNDLIGLGLNYHSRSFKEKTLRNIKTKKLLSIVANEK